MRGSDNVSSSRRSHRSLISWEVADAQLFRQIEYLKNFNTYPTVRQSFRDAASYLMDRGRSRLRARMNKRTSTGAIGRSMVIKTDKIGALVGFDVSREHGRLSWLIDKGTRQRSTKDGYNRGRVVGNRFWTDTREQDMRTALDIIRHAITQQINIMNQ